MRVTKWENDGPNRAQIGVYSYGETTPEIPQSQFEFNVSKFRDPAGQAQFKGAKGSDPDVRDWVCQDNRTQALKDHCLLLASDLLVPKKVGDKVTEPISHWVSFGFLDHHGKWISPALAEAIGNCLSDAGFNVIVVHYGLKQPKS